MSVSAKGVLLIGPLPPPYGGQSVLVRDILESGLSGSYPLLPFNVTHCRPGGVRRLIMGIWFALRLVCRLATLPCVGVLHVHSSAGVPLLEKSLFILIGRLFGRRTLLHLHGGRLQDAWEGSGRGMRRLTRWLIDRNHAVVVLGAGTREYLRGAMGCRTAIHVLPNAVRVETPVPAAPGGGKTVFLYVGHLKAEKGLLDLCTACGLLPPELWASCELRIMGIGDTPENERVVREAFREAGLSNVRFLGLKAGADKWCEFAMAHVFVLPSHSEDLPLTVLEAMGCGLPVVATAVGAIPEVVREGENGFLVPTRAPDLLAQCMTTLALRPELRAEFGRTNRDRYEREYSFERYERELAGIYEAVLA